MITCTRRLQFCAGHRVFKHESKCANVHGHNYVVHLTARRNVSGTLDSVGRVVEFADLKYKVGKWIENNWDHGFIYFKDDPVMRDLYEGVDSLGDGPGALSKQKHFVLPKNPTVENLAAYLLWEVCPKVLEGSEVEVFRIVMHETENCSAEVSL